MTKPTVWLAPIQRSEPVGWYLGQNTDPLNIQAGAESGPKNQMSLNVLENASIQSLGVDNADISSTQGTLQAVDDFELASQTLIPLGDKWEPLANA